MVSTPVPPLSRRRAILVWVLIGLASLLALISTLTLWTKRQLLDDKAFGNTASSLLANQQVQTALAVKINDAVYREVDLDAELRQRLPKAAQSASPVIASAIQNGSERAIEAFLATSAAQQLWTEVTGRAHHAVVNVLKGKPAGPLSTNQNGDVILNLQPIVDRVANRLGLGDAIASRAPPGSNQIILLHSDQLQTAKDSVFLLRVLSVAIAIVVFVLYALAIYLARGRRRIALETTGGSLVIVGLLVLVIRRVVGDVLVNSLVKTDANRPAAHAAWQILTNLLADLSLALIAYGLLAVLAGFLAGPSRAATWIRRELFPTFKRGPWVVHGVGLALFLIVVAWGPTGATRELIGVIVLAVLFFGGLEVWRRMTIREFTEPEPAPKRDEEPPPVTVTLPG